MKFGLGSFVYRWSIGRDYYRPSRPMTVLDFLDRTAALGVDRVMLCNNFALEAFTEPEVTTLKERAALHRITLELGGRGSQADCFIRLVGLCERLDARVLRITADIDRRQGADAIRRQPDDMRRYLCRVLAEAKPRGIRLALENYHGITLDELVAVIQAINDATFGACIDTANSAALIEHPLEVTRRLAPYAVSVHIKDFKVEMSERGHRILGVPLGEGMVDFPQVLAILRQQGYTGNLFAEMYLDRTEDEASTLAFEDECVRRCVRYAREVLKL
jgi:sugar phosphate isomerase/epimerase